MGFVRLILVGVFTGIYVRKLSNLIIHLKYYMKKFFVLIIRINLIFGHYV